MKQVTNEEILYAMQKFYMEYGKDRDLEYTFGFFDALGVLRDVMEGRFNG